MNLIPAKSEKSLAARFNRMGDLRYQAEKQHLLAHIQRNDKIARCSPESIEHAMLQVADIGLTLNPAAAHVYLVPYWNKATRESQLQPLIGYRGLLHLVYRAGTIKDVQANLVHANDPVFRVRTTVLGREIEHEEALRSDNRGEVTHAYVIARFANGGHHVEVMDAEQLAAVERAAKARSDAGGKVWNGPWRGEMMKKAVIRRAWKHWPLDGEIQHAMTALDRLEPVELDNDEPEVCITEEQAMALHAQCIDAGMDETLASKWMHALARRYGLRQITDLPASRYDGVRQELAGYIAEWRANK